MSNQRIKPIILHLLPCCALATACIKFLGNIFLIVKLKVVQMNKYRKHRPKAGLCSQAIALMHVVFALPELFSFPDVWIIPSHSGVWMNINSTPSKENQTRPLYNWYYPDLVVYIRLAYLRAMFNALFMKFNPPWWTKEWCLEARRCAPCNKKTTIQQLAMRTEY